MKGSSELIYHHRHGNQDPRKWTTQRYLGNRWHDKDYNLSVRSNFLSKMPNTKTIMERTFDHIKIEKYSKAFTTDNVCQEIL